MTDTELLEKYEGLVRKLSYTNKVYGFESEDLQQEFRMLLLTCNTKFDPNYGVEFSTYFVKSCKNKVSKLRKKEDNYLSLNAQIDKVSGQEFIDFIETKVVNPMEEVLNGELNEQVLSALDKLKYGYYTLWYLVYGVSQSDIAKIEGTDRYMVSRRHRNNLKILRRKFQK